MTLHLWCYVLKVFSLNLESLEFIERVQVYEPFDDVVFGFGYEKESHGESRTVDSGNEMFSWLYHTTNITQVKLF